MPMIMLHCKPAGEVFPGIYISEGSTVNFKIGATDADISRGQNYKYAAVDYMDWS
jgi:hypothetical protein